VLRVVVAHQALGRADHDCSFHAVAQHEQGRIARRQEAGEA
jgi:hypothetical protein